MCDICPSMYSNNMADSSSDNILELVMLGVSVSFAVGFFIYFGFLNYFFSMTILQSAQIIAFLYVACAAYDFCKIFIFNKKIKPTIKGNEWAIITGCTSGLGKAMAEDLARQQYNLILIARNQKVLDELAFNINYKYKVKTLTLTYDFANGEVDALYTGISSAINRIENNSERVTILVNNVGISNDITDEFDNYELKHDNELIDVNIKSMLVMTKLILPALKKQQFGTIINISSGSAYQRCPYISTYGSTKAFVRHFTNSLRVEYKKYNVNFHVSMPLFFKSNMVKEKENLFIPSAEVISDGILRQCTVIGESTPYFFHWYQIFITSWHWFPNLSDLILSRIYERKKKERERKKV